MVSRRRQHLPTPAHLAETVREQGAELGSRFHQPGLFGESFATFAYHPAEAAEMGQAVGLRITRVTFLTQTVLPFNTLIPEAHVCAGADLGRRAPAAVLPRLGADFAVFAERHADPTRRHRRVGKAAQCGTGSRQIAVYILRAALVSERRLAVPSARFPH